MIRLATIYFVVFHIYKTIYWHKGVFSKKIFFKKEKEVSFVHRRVGTSDGRISFCMHDHQCRRMPLLLHRSHLTAHLYFLYFVNINRKQKRWIDFFLTDIFHYKYPPKAGGRILSATRNMLDIFFTPVHLKACKMQILHPKVRKFATKLSRDKTLYFKTQSQILNIKLHTECK